MKVYFTETHKNCTLFLFFESIGVVFKGIFQGWSVGHGQWYIELELFQPFKRQPLKMVKHTQIIRHETIILKQKVITVQTFKLVLQLNPFHATDLFLTP